MGVKQQKQVDLAAPPTLSGIKHCYKQPYLTQQNILYTRSKMIKTNIVCVSIPQCVYRLVLLPLWGRTFSSGNGCLGAQAAVIRHSPHIDSKTSECAFEHHEMN